jgi:hypothetical protein
MLSRNNSAQSNLSAAAAATALKRASSQTNLQDGRPASAGPEGTGLQTSPRPGLRRRTSSMSERSFRAQAPEEHAREKRDRPASIVDGAATSREGSVKRKGSFSLPKSLRSNSSSKKTTAPGVIQPLPQQQNKRATGSQSHKFKTTLRGDRPERPMSPMSPTHSAMKLPHPPGIGSGASSIRSFQTDLSSIAEDHPIDYSHIPQTKVPGHLIPVKSAMKGGSGPPSIISEAISEESKSSLGTHDRRNKQRVSFSDEQENSPVVNSTKPKETQTHLKPHVARAISPPASPPMSPKVTPQIPTIIPSIVQAPASTPVMTAESKAPVTSAETSLPSPSPEKEPKTTLEPIKIPPSAPQPPKEESTPPPQESVPANVGIIPAIIPAVTIHVPSTPSPPKQVRLPGAFPDPTPEPTPPSTANSQTSVSEPQEPSPSPNTQRELDLQRGLSLRTMNLVPTRQTGLLGPIAELTRSESQDSSVSIYSDAVDVIPENRMSPPKIITVPTSAPPKTDPTPVQTKGVPPVITETDGVRSPVTEQPSASPISPNRASPTRKPVPPTFSPTTPQKPAIAPIITTGTTIPLDLPMKSTSRQNGTPKSTSRPQSVPAASPPKDKKLMRMSMREGAGSTNASATDMARGLMAMPRIERVPSDSSYKRMKPRNESAMRTTLRDKPQRPLGRRRGSDSSSDFDVSGRQRSSSIFGRFRGGGGRKDSDDRADVARQDIITSSRLRDSTDEEELPPPPPRQEILDTESLPSSSPRLRKRTSFSQFFGFGGRKEPDRRATSQTLPTTQRPVVQTSPIQPIAVPTAPAAARTDTGLTKTTVVTDAVGDGGHRRTRSGSIYSKRTGKEKRFQLLRRLFRIKE